MNQIQTNISSLFIQTLLPHKENTFFTKLGMCNNTVLVHVNKTAHGFSYYF